MKVSHWMSCFAVGVSLLGAPPAGAFEYRFSLLPPLGGIESGASSINNAGQIAGWSQTSTDSSGGATVWTDGVPTGLASPAGVSYSRANGINDRGQVVGTSSGFRDSRAVLWNAGIPAELEPSGDNFSVAQAINDRGQVAGASGRSDRLRATVWHGEAATDLGTPEGKESAAFGMNNHGQVVGRSYTADFPDERPILWHNGSVTELGGLAEGGSGSALDINDAGQVVGWSQHPESYEHHATLWNKDDIVDLGSLPGGGYSEAHAINASGQVVGYSWDVEGINYATLWKGTEIFKLEDLVDPSSMPVGWIMHAAKDINDRGVIVGEAFYIGPEPYGWRGYVLTPIPEPHTIVLLMAGLSVIAGTARRRSNAAARKALAVS